jgi:hypothetical protein
MLRLHVPLPTRYVDFGKVFVPNGALDFSTLAASDADVAHFGAQLFNRGLVFPESSPFAGQIGSISAALLMFEGGFLFALVQRRREGELSTDPRTDRPFNQVRFVLLNREMIEQAFASRASLYCSLALAARDPQAKVWLRDYTAPIEQLTWQPTLDRLDPEAPSPEAIRFVANALVTAAEGNKPQPISVPLPGQDLLEKLRLVEAVQYWLLPKLGVLSFALDYVSIQNVHLRLFALPPDAPAPLPPERVFMPGLAGDRFGDDYHTPVSSLAHEALYDAALPELLGLRASAAEAVSLYRVEKRAEPLPGTKALRLYPEIARLGERRFNLLRRVPPADQLELLRNPDLLPELRLDLLRVAFEAAHGLLVLYAQSHLVVPRPARDDERVRAILRASLAKSPEASLAVGSPEEQTELYHDLLLARRRTPPAGRGQPAPPPAMVLDTGLPLLEALFLGRRTPALAAALAEVAPQDPSIFAEALAVIDRATDLKGLLWLWRNAGQRDLTKYAALLERAVQPAWYPTLARDAATWQELLADGRGLALEAHNVSVGEPAPGVLLRALPRPVVPFVWQASLATAEHDAAFAEWWLFNEALALPDELSALWDALLKLPAATLHAASPELNYLLGRAAGLSLLRACTPPGESEPNEALYATALRGWLANGFRSPAGELALGAADVAFLVAHLPGSNDILAAIAASPAQAAAVRGLTSEQALAWARGAAGDRRQPYRVNGKDWLFQRLIELPTAGEDLPWHLLTEDEGTAPAVMPWADYVALVARIRAQFGQPPAKEEGGTGELQPADGSRLRALLDIIGLVQNKEVPDTFYENHIDIRRVFALLAAHSPEPADGADLLVSLMPLAVFHLQETGPELKGRATALLRAGLQQPDVNKHLQGMPDNVLVYLRDQVCQGQPALTAPGHWIDAELSRRKNAYRLEVAAKAASPRRGSARPPVDAAQPSTAQPAASTTAGPASAPLSQGKTNAAPAPPPPAGKPARDAASKPANSASQASPAPLLGQIVLPGAAPKKADSAMWLWIAIVVIGVLALVVVIGALVWVQSLH